jgi:putative oxidoreductase
VTFGNDGNIMGIIGRFLVGSAFVFAGLRHLSSKANFGGLAALLAARNIPFPRFSLGIGTAFHIIAGLAFAFGIERQAAGAGLIVFTFAATTIGHNFWDKSGFDRTADLLAWQANSAIVGGILLGMT